MSGVEIVRTAKEGEWTVTVKCPFCAKRHTHGKGGAYSELTGFGLRESHCREGGAYVILRASHGPRYLGTWGGDAE